ncbi:MAG: hypothetical protein WAO35_12320 [Terriglobia bacterium]
MSFLTCHDPYRCGASPWSHLPTLTTAGQVRELTADQAKRVVPVRLRAVITYGDFALGDFFAQDSTAGIYVSENSKSLHFRPGDLLEIDGITEELDFAPQITEAGYRSWAEHSCPSLARCIWAICCRLVRTAKRFNSKASCKRSILTTTG